MQRSGAAILHRCTRLLRSPVATSPSRLAQTPHCGIGKNPFHRLCTSAAATASKGTVEEVSSDNHPASSQAAAVTPADLRGLSTLDSLLGHVNQRDRFSVTNAVEIVNAIALQTTNESLQDCSEDPRLVKVMNLLASPGVNYVETKGVIKCLKSLGLLGVPEDSFAVKNLENSLTWRARTCSMRDLTMMLSFSVGRRTTDTQIKLCKEVIRSLERRWVEINDGRTFVGILHYPELFTEQFIAKLEDRLTEICESLPPAELTYILKELGLKKRRTVPLLKAIAFHLTKNKNDLDIKQASDCLFALNKLVFKDIDCLESLSHVCETQIPQTDSAAVVRSILTSLGQIKFRHQPLLDQITRWYSTHLDELQDKDLISYLLTTATLNYAPASSDDLFKVIVSRLATNTLSNEPKNEVLWLDIVWSLVALGKATDDHFQSVLSSEFYNKLLYSHDHRNVGIILKVLNINAAAKYIFNFSGPTINVSEDPLLRDVKVVPRMDKTKLAQNVLDVFHSLAAPPTHLEAHVNTLMGFYCDAECVFDANLKPLPISRHAMFAKSADDSKPLPDGAQRVALMVMTYNDCLVGHGAGDLTGLANLSVRLLQARGFKVMTVRYDDLKPNQKKIERIKVLEKKLTALL